MYKGMSKNALLSTLPTDMSAAVLRNTFTIHSHTGPVMYGAGARETADERLIEGVKARRPGRAEVTFQQRTGTQKAYVDSLEVIDEQLAEARRRRAFLEEELEKARDIEATLMRRKAKAVEVKDNRTGLEKARAEKERKRQAAFKRKLEEGGGKPAGVRRMGFSNTTLVATQRKIGNRP